MQAPVAAEADWEQLGRSYELAGGSIKNAVVSCRKSFLKSDAAHAASVSARIDYVRHLPLRPRQKVIYDSLKSVIEQELYVRGCAGQSPASAMRHVETRARAAVLTT